MASLRLARTRVPAGGEVEVMENVAVRRPVVGCIAWLNGWDVIKASLPEKEQTAAVREVAGES
jgi:hypothetical protein